MSRRPVEIRIGELVIPCGSAAEGARVATALAQRLASADRREDRTIPRVDLEQGAGPVTGDWIGRELRRTVDG